MRILECPKCGNLIPIEHNATHGYCNCHNPMTHLSSRKHLIGTLTRRKVRQAQKLAKELNVNASKLLSDLLEIKSCG